MPPISLSPISSAAVKVRWREPYASEGLNRKMAVVVPAGVYRGLKLGVSASNLSVDLLADAAGDHVAVQESATGFSATYVDDTSGTITLPLTGFVTNDVVVVCLVVNYASGVSTTAEFRGYVLADYNALSASARAALVVLGTVLRSASGIIPAVNITHDRRTLPFLRRTDESTPWNPLLRNGGFELSYTNVAGRYNSPFWLTYSTNASFSLKAVTTESHSGSKSLELTGAAPGTVQGQFYQDLYVPVTPGRYIMARLYKKALKAATGSPIGRIRFLFGDQDGTNNVNEDIVYAVNAIDASFVEVTGIIKVPVTARVLKGVYCTVDGTYAGTGPCIRIDDVQAWMQVDASEWLDVLSARTGEGSFQRLFLGNSNSFGNLGAVLHYGAYAASPFVVEVESGFPQDNIPGPALSVPARNHVAVKYTLVFQSIPPGAPGYRKYVSSAGRMLDVVNASYNRISDQWTKDVTGTNAFRVEAKENGFSNYSMVDDPDWLDADWIEHLQGANAETATLANPKFAPLLMARDAGGNRRVAIDHLGHRGGRVTELHQPWIAPYLAAWNTSTAGTGAASTIYTDPNIPGPARRLFVNANNDRISNYGYQLCQGPLQSGQVHVIEFELNATDLIGTPFLTFAGGFLHDETADPSTEDHVKFYKTAANANWQFLSSGTTQQSTNTGVAPTSFQKFRIELYGSGHPGGARALGYIDGVLVAEHTTVTALPANDLASIVFLFKATGVLSNKQVIVSPVRYWGRRYLSDDAL